MFILNFLIIPYLIIAFGGFDAGITFALTMGKEFGTGALRVERNGGQIVEEIEKDYPSITIGTVKSLFKEQSGR